MGTLDYIDWESALGLPPESIDDDIKGIDELKVSSRLYKTEEEIQRYTLPEDLDEIERVLFLLRNGSNIQAMSVISSFQRLLQTNRSETISIVLPIVLEQVQGRSADFQLATGSMLIYLLEKHQLSEKYVDMIAPAAFKLLESKDEDIVLLWADVLIASMAYMSVSLIENEILPGALLDGGFAKPAPLRIWSCRVLGAAAARLPSSKVEEFFRQAMVLCQDTDYEVRACMCDQLNAFVKAIKLDSSKRELMHEYVELVMDDELYVREAALSNMANLVEFADDSTKLNVILPLWRRMCDEMPFRLLRLLCKEFGRFFFNCKGVISEADRKFFLSFYHNMAKSDEEEHRSSCAYNLPAILHTLGPDSFEACRLDWVLEQLSQDSSFEVRKRIASGFHEIAKTLRKKSYMYLRSVFLRLIHDSEVTVYQVIFDHTHDILLNFSYDEQAKRTSNFDELLFTLLRLEREYAADPTIEWRVHFSLIKQFQHFHMYFDSDHLFHQCVPILFKVLTDNVTIPIKESAISAISLYLCKIRRLDYRDRIAKQIIELKDSTRYHTRLLFLQFLNNLVNIVSLRYLRDTFLDDYLSTSRDSVANIRLYFLKLCRYFAKSCAISSTRLISNATKSTPPKSSTTRLCVFKEIVDCLSALACDVDKDVSMAAKSELSYLGILGYSSSIKDEDLEDVKNNLSAKLTEEELLEQQTREAWENSLIAEDLEDTSRSKDLEDIRPPGAYTLGARRSTVVGDAALPRKSTITKAHGSVTHISSLATATSKKTGKAGVRRNSVTSSSINTGAVPSVMAGDRLSVSSQKSSAIKPARSLSTNLHSANSNCSISTSFSHGGDSAPPSSLGGPIEARRGRSAGPATTLLFKNKSAINSKMTTTNKAYKLISPSSSNASFGSNEYVDKDGSGNETLSNSSRQNSTKGSGSNQILRNSNPSKRPTLLSTVGRAPSKPLPPINGKN
ncbi:Serine/threonine-protein phosphatase 4 regulatory subunit 4 [Chytridiales sp. JEL 0842]|nr:Serine/threonine-protein phosphatase 4 regulatory subunit 4 [Chytridiales sp. JEL 0842]